MNRGYNSKRVFRVRCQSGIIGWRTRLRNNYASLQEFLKHNDVYRLSYRLGFDSAADAWMTNPIIEGSTEPLDFRRVS